MTAIGLIAGAATVGLLTLVGLGFRIRRRLLAAPTLVIGEAAGLGHDLAPFVRPYRLPLAVALLLTVVSTALGLLSPWSLKILLDNVVGGASLPSWLPGLEGLSPARLAFAVTAGGLGLVLLNVVVDYLVAVTVGATEQRLAADLRAAVFEQLHHLSLDFHDRHRSGDLVARLSDDVGRVRDALVAWFDQVAPDALTLIGILAVITAIDPVLTLAALSVVPLLGWYARSRRPLMRSAERVARDRQGELAALATDSLRNVRLVQAFSRQPEEAARFRRQLDRTADASITSLDLSARYSPLASMVLAAGSAMVAWVGVLRVLDGRLTVGTLVVFLSYLSGVYSPIRRMSRLVSTFAKGSASRARLAELFDDAHRVTDDPEAQPARPGPATLELRDVAFAYREDAPVLHHLDLTVAPGRSVCLVGASGAGKSTVLALVLRLYQPTSGSIELDGVDIRRLTLRSLRERITLVPQEPWTIDGTVAENIRFADPGADDDHFRAAVDGSLVSELEDRLPLGLDTPVGESGSLLSGGQLRRIALARALLRDASILLLDEPTTGLDATSTAEVLASLDRVAAERTLLVVSHDLSVAARVGRVAVLDGGTIVEAGSHDELLALGGRYARLWSAQQGDGSGADSISTEAHEEGGERHERILHPRSPRTRRRLAERPVEEPFEEPVAELPVAELVAGPTRAPGGTERLLPSHPGLPGHEQEVRA